MYDNDRSQTIQQLNESLWAWVSKNINRAQRTQLPFRTHQSAGVLGHRVSYRGFGAFSSKSDLSREFIRYLETPESVKKLAELLDRLVTNDFKIYVYIVLKARGHSYDDMNQLTDIFPKFVSGSDRKRQASIAAQKYNHIAIEYLWGALPEDIKSSFGSEIVAEMATKHIVEDRVVCPRCNGTNPDCFLCAARNGFEWDGKVFKRRSRHYKKWIRLGNSDDTYPSEYNPNWKREE